MTPPTRLSAAALPAGAFLIAGVGVGIVGWVTTGWAEAAFATEATGDAERFGPIFVAQLTLAITTAALVGAPLLAAVLGVLVGSRSFDAGEGALVSGVGAGVGALLYGLVVVALVVLSGGEAASQSYDASEALWPVVATAVAAGLVGAGTGALGAGAS
ncbi:hypothetical protein JCM17823_05230 [Halorubrum gandharaense]